MSRRIRKPKSPLALLFFASSMVVAIVLVLTTFRSRTVESLLDQARERAEALDYQGALREADLAMQAALRTGDPELVAQVLELRADYYRRRGALDKALVDYQRILDDFPPSAKQVPNIVASISSTMVRAGRFQDAADICIAALVDTPTHAILWMRLAEARSGEAKSILEALTQRFVTVLTFQKTMIARRLTVRLAALELDDPQAIAVRHNLRSLFPVNLRSEEELILSELARAAALNSEARTAYARSFEGYVSVLSVGGLVDLVAASERESELVDLGLALLPLPASERDPVALQVLAQTLEHRGRPKVAAQVVDRLLASERRIGREFKPRWCHILHSAEHWQRLENVAQGLRNSPGSGRSADYLRATGNLYLGLALLKLGRYPQAQVALQRFVQSGQAEPFVGARGEAFLGLAEAASAQALYEDERIALETGLSMMPDLSGEGWLRLADLKTQYGDRPREIEQALAHAMRLLPDAEEQLRPRWVEAGERSAAERGVDHLLLYQSLVEEGRWYPRVPGGSYELYRLASEAFSRARFHGAAEASRRLLADYPHFGPAVAMLLDALQLADEQQQAAEVMLGELESGLGGAELADRLHSLPPDTLSNSQVLRLMRADPARTGLLTIARGLSSGHQQREALQGLALADSKRLGDEGRIVTATIWMDLSYWEQALGALKDVPQDSPYYSQALRLKIEAALNVREREVVEGVLAEVAEAEILDRDELMPVVDRLLRRRHWSGASILLDRLDALPATRGGDVMLRQAVAALSGGNPALTREHLDRAEAYRSDGGPEIGRLLLYIEQRNWAWLPRTVREVWSSDMVPSAFQEALFLALEERVGEALEILDEERQEHPEDPLLALASIAVSELAGKQAQVPSGWGESGARETRWLMRGTRARPRDARDTLGLLLALDVPEWSIWALARLGEMEGSQLWTNYLRAVAYQVLEEDLPARNFLRLTATRWPDFAPAWALLEGIEERRLGRPDHPQMLELRAERRAALGDVAGEEAERALAIASRQADAGEFAKALDGARAARGLRADFAPADLLIARTSAALDHLDSAVGAYASYLESTGAAAGDEVVDEFLQVLELAAAEGALQLPALSAELGALEIVFPEHPLVALAQAKLSLKTASAGPSAGLGRGLLRLEEFREATDHRPLDELRPESSAAWCAFLMDYDPVRAEDLIRSELTQQPESLELWLLLGETLEAQGRLWAAVEHYQTVAAMIPDTRVMRRLVALLAEFGGRENEVRELLDRIQKNELLRQLDPQLKFVQAYGLVNAGPAQRDEGINQLAGLWKLRAGLAGSLDITELGIRYGFSLARRGRSADSGLARAVLLEVLPDVKDKARSDVVLAVANLVKYLPKPKPKPEPQPEQESESGPATAPVGAAPEPGRTAEVAARKPTEGNSN